MGDESPPGSVPTHVVRTHAARRKEARSTEDSARSFGTSWRRTVISALIEDSLRSMMKLKLAVAVLTCGWRIVISPACPDRKGPPARMPLKSVTFKHWLKTCHRINSPGTGSRRLNGHLLRTNNVRTVRLIDRAFTSISHIQPWLASKLESLRPHLSTRSGSLGMRRGLSGYR
jgi:hypothetical protein